MKLLTPNQVLSEKEKVFGFNLKRSKELEDLIVSKGKEYDKIKNETEILIQQQIIILENEKASYIKGINELKSEVEKLKEEKRLALIPLDTRWKELEKAEQIYKKKEIALEAQKGALESRLDALGERLDKVAEREQGAKQMATKQAMAQEGIDKQKEQIKLQNESFNEVFVSKMKEMEDKKIKLEKKEAEIEFREETLRNKQEELDKIEAEFKNRERQIQDKYETLQRTIQKYAS